MIKGAKTISQYKILQWVHENFETGCVTVEFNGENTAIITDKEGQSLNLSYNRTEGVMIVKN